MALKINKDGSVQINDYNPAHYMTKEERKEYFKEQKRKQIIEMGFDKYNAFLKRFNLKPLPESDRYLYE